MRVEKRQGSKKKLDAPSREHSKRRFDRKLEDEEITKLHHPWKGSQPRVDVKGELAVWALGERISMAARLVGAP